MSEDIGVEEVAAFLQDERKYDRELTRKEFHKLMYFARLELQNLGVSADIPYFWYKFGTMTPTTEEGVLVDRTEGTVECSKEPEEMGIRPELESEVRLGVSRVLNRYYELGLEGLTDAMYEDAPYEVQRKYRTLDKQLGKLSKDDSPSDLDTSSLRESVFDIVDAFPKEEFPECKKHLLIWYSIMDEELDSNDFSASHARDITEAFWTIFSVELAQRESAGVDLDEIVTTLGTDRNTFFEYAEEMKTKLRMHDKERIEITSEDVIGVNGRIEDERTEEAVTAVAKSVPDIPTP
jgi:hypothetical protein